MEHCHRITQSENVASIGQALAVLMLIICQGQASCVNGDVRLAEGVNEFEGRLEICYQGVWEPVCRASDLPNVCNQLGFNSGVTASFSIQSRAEAVLNLTCPRRARSASECTLTRISKTACGTNDDGTVAVTSLVCSADCTAGEIRLAGGTEVSGRVEICSSVIRGVWGVVCDSGWDNRDAQVVCRELGLLKQDEAPTATTAHQSTPGSVSVYENAQCIGSEARLLNCQHSRITRLPSICSLAGVICSSSDTQPTTDTIVIALLQTTVGASEEHTTTLLPSTQATSELERIPPLFCKLQWALQKRIPPLVCKLQWAIHKSIPPPSLFYKLHSVLHKRVMLLWCKVQ